MAKQSGEQKEIIREIMHEYKHGELKSSSGAHVKNRKQAVAIALHEAGASQEESPAKNRENMRRTSQRKRGKSDEAGLTRHELYNEAQRKGVKGRSRMSKAELCQALGH